MVSLLNTLFRAGKKENQPGCFSFQFLNSQLIIVSCDAKMATNECVELQTYAKADNRTKTGCEQKLY